MKHLLPSSRAKITAVLVAALVGVAACDEQTETAPVVGPEGGEVAAAAQGGNGPTFAEALRAQQRNDRRMRGKAGVVGTAVGVNADGHFSVVLYLLRPEAAPGLPDRLDQVPVEMVVTGPFVADADETSRQRPAPVGFSVGHPDITAGTLGARVKDGSGNFYILSNNHVLANSNDASIGDPTLQPGPYDGGTASDSLAWLADFVPMAFDGSTNYVDAAVSRTISDNVHYMTSAEGYGTPSATIYDLDADEDPGTISTISSDLVGLAVQKYGRTTGLTTGEVEEVNVSVDVCYECAGPFCFSCSASAHFEDQISITPGDFSDGGDSGSLIVTNSSSANPVGLLFAGSSSRTLANRIDRALNAFGVSVDDGSGSDGGDTNSAPTASFTDTCTDLSCDFDGSGSSDTDGSISSYEWDFGDGATGTGVTASHTYDTDGTYTVTLTVTDNDGATDSQSRDVSVSSSTDDGAGGIHVGDLDGSQANNGSTWTATVTVLVHDAEHTVEDGSSVTLSYSGGASGTKSCTTGSAGTCSVSVGEIHKRNGSVTFTVDGISDSDGSYSSADNHDPDGDSDGTTITVNKP